MPRPALIAHHIIWTAYGTWLPNDPRGPTSKFVASDEIAALGPHHYGRRAKQPSRESMLDFYHLVIRKHRRRPPGLERRWPERRRSAPRHRWPCAGQFESTSCL